MWAMKKVMTEYHHIDTDLPLPEFTLEVDALLARAGWTRDILNMARQCYAIQGMLDVDLKPNEYQMWLMSDHKRKMGTLGVLL